MELPNFGVDQPLSRGAVWSLFPESGEPNLNACWPRYLAASGASCEQWHGSSGFGRALSILCGGVMQCTALLQRCCWPSVDAGRRLSSFAATHLQSDSDDRLAMKQGLLLINLCHCDCWRSATRALNRGCPARRADSSTARIRRAKSLPHTGSFNEACAPGMPNSVLCPEPRTRRLIECYCVW
ncbi:unnamed protein product [Effrenium voratum]|nr:unnamed protein product [Effrenium voratum]